MAIIYKIHMDVERIPREYICDPDTDFRIIRGEADKTLHCLEFSSESDAEAVRFFRALWDDSRFIVTSTHVTIREYYLEKYDDDGEAFCDFLEELEESDIPDGTEYTNENTIPVSHFRYNRSRNHWEDVL